VTGNPSIIFPPTFPPLFRGERVQAGLDPLAKATAAAMRGIDAGTIFWADRDDLMDVALVLAPERTLEQAMVMVPTMMVGLADSVGALAPPEVGVSWFWPDDIRVNGAKCGVVRAAAATDDPACEPDWLVVALTLQRASAFDDPGDHAEFTSLMDEGCVDLTVTQLIESWARHALVWINRWEDDGFAPIHESWRGRAESVGEQIDVTIGGEVTASGLFLGVDENGGMLLKRDGATDVLPLTEILGAPNIWTPLAQR